MVDTRILAKDSTGDVMCEVRPSAIVNAGQGLFALHDMMRGTIITEFGGCLVDYTEASRLRREGRGDHLVAVELGRSARDGSQLSTADARHGRYASLANACQYKKDANAHIYHHWDRREARQRVFLRAARDIDAGEEIVTWYGNNFWHLNANASTVVRIHIPQDYKYDYEKDEISLQEYHQVYLGRYGHPPQAALMQVSAK